MPERKPGVKERFIVRTRSQPKWISHVRRRHTRGRCIICRYMRRILQNAPGAWPCRDPPVHFRGRRRCCRPPARRDGAQGNRGGSAQPTRLRRLCDASAEHAPAAAQRASPGRRAAGPHDHPPIVCDGCTQDVAAACRAPLDAHADACARAPAATWGMYGGSAIFGAYASVSRQGGPRMFFGTDNP